MFVGRERERARIDRLLGDARAGRSGALLMHGEAGIGKTALMRWAIGQASGMRVLRARGIETESDIPFAGLAELVTPLLDRLDDVPEVQARALRGALALGPATPHDRFTVPAGLLSLLAVAAEEQPVLVAIDDAQWLDEASLEAFLFAGRRIEAEGIAMLGSLRDGTAIAGMDVPWLERLAVPPLADDEARELLGTAQPERLAPSVADRLVSTAAGNPLALLEIPRQLSDGQRAGREPLEEPLRPGTGVERAFRRALDALGDGARRALLVAATAHTGRIDVIEPALIASGLALDDLRPAEDARLLSIAEGEVDFRHPLLRSTAYHAASAAERRAAHSALAAAAPGGSPERAWHLAACAVAPDEEVAAALEAAALDARGRGAHATAARDFGRAAQLTPEDEPRARRLLEAATDATRSGEADRALALLGDAARLAVDPLLAADVQRMTGHVEMRRGSPLVAYELLVAEAERVRSRDPRRAAGMFLEASVSHMITGDMHALVATAERARALATSADPAVELLATAVIGEAHLALGDVEQGDALLSACEPYLLEGDPLAIVEVVGMAAHSSIWIEKFDRAQRIFDRLIAAARDASAVSALIYPLAARSHLDFRLGRWAAARAGAAESVELAQDTGQLPILAHSLGALAHVEAALGQEEECRSHVSEGLALVSRFQGDALLSACEPYLLEGDPLAIVEVVGMAAHSSIWIEKFDRAQRIFDRLIAAARDASAVSALIYPLAARSHLDFRLGRWAAARAGAAESVELAHDTGQLPVLAHSLGALAHVEAALGQEDECRSHVTEGLALVSRFQGDATGTYLTAALGLLELGLGRIPEAIAVLEDTQRTADRLGMQPSLVMSTPDLVEAYARAGRREEAQELLEAFEARGRRTGSRWAEAATARLRGLLAPAGAMRAQFDAALALHDGLPMPFERARTLLCLGEGMRRARQRADAREPLKEALETFERLGARGWAERARTELRATGEQQSRRTETAAEQLTPHELQIAVLVAQGMTNRETAAALFLSPKTIEYHLGQIYRKLDVRGRAQLARLMAMELPEGERDPSVLAEALS